MSGVVVGLLAGLLLGPVIRFWLAWREWAEASREARLTQDVLTRMDGGPRGGSSDAIRLQAASGGRRPKS